MARSRAASTASASRLPSREPPPTGPAPTDELDAEIVHVSRNLANREALRAERSRLERLIQTSDGTSGIDPRIASALADEDLVRMEIYSRYF